MAITIELTDKERTALSLMLGLRQKFARESKTDEVYTAREMHRLFSECLDKINKQEITYLDTLRIREDKKQENEVWDKIQEKIDRSGIQRFDWTKVFNQSLTREILSCMNKGIKVKDCVKLLQTDERVLHFISQHKYARKKILDNIEISVHARYGENETAKKMREKDE